MINLLNPISSWFAGEKASALYLSLRYHTLNPNYIHERLKTFTGSELRVLLVQVDISEPHHALKQLMRISILILQESQNQSRSTKKLEWEIN